MKIFAEFGQEIVRKNKIRNFFAHFLKNFAKIMRKLKNVRKFVSF